MSLIGLALCTITVAVHFSYRFIRIKDVGVGMFLSLTNALLLVFTLLWGLMGIMEFRMLLKAYKNTKNKLKLDGINKEEFINELKRYKTNLSINSSYLVLVMCQLVYVICNWDEVNI